MSIIQQKINDGKVVLFCDYEQGHTLDLSGNNNHASAIDDVSFNPDGAHFIEQSSRITIPDSTSLRLTAGSIIVYSRSLQGPNPGNHTFVAKREGANPDYQWYFNTSAGGFQFRGPTNTVTLAATERGTCYGISFTDGQIPTGYIDGVLIGSYDAATDLNDAGQDLFIGNVYFDNVYYAHRSLGKVLILSEALTEEEHYQMFQELKLIKHRHYEVSKNYIRALPVRADCVGAYDGEVTKTGQYKDSSTQKAHMSLATDARGLYDITPLGNAVSGAEVAPTAAQQLTGRPMSFGCWFKPYGADSNQLWGQAFESYRFWYGATANKVDVRLDSNSYVKTFSDVSLANVWSHYLAVLEADGTVRLYRDGVEDTAAQGTYTAYWPPAAGNMRIGTSNGIAAINGLVSRCRVWNAALTPEEVMLEYHQSAEAIVYDLGNIPQNDFYGAGKIIGRFTSLDGGTLVEAEMRDNVPITYFRHTSPPFTDRIIVDALDFENNTQLSVGTWEFEFYKTSAQGTNSRVIVIASSSADWTAASQNGYAVEFTYQASAIPGRVYLYRITAGARVAIATSADNVIPYNEWFHFAVARDGTGRISSYVNGECVTTPVQDTTHNSGRYFFFRPIPEDRMRMLRKRLGAMSC